MDHSILFYILAFLTLYFGVSTVMVRNPIYSALCLVMTMVWVGCLFMNLGAYFLGAVQLAVYAGAVMVLFVMVLMLFDLKQELKAFSRGTLSGTLKLFVPFLTAGFATMAAIKSTDMMLSPRETMPIEELPQAEAVATALFSKYVFGFEAVSVLLLVVVVGAVALSRIIGGTHARS